VFPYTVVKYLAQCAASQRHEDQKIITAPQKKGCALDAFGFVKIESITVEIELADSSLRASRVSRRRNDRLHRLQPAPGEFL